MIISIHKVSGLSVSILTVNFVFSMPFKKSSKVSPRTELILTLPPLFCMVSKMRQSITEYGRINVVGSCMIQELMPEIILQA